MIAKQVGKVLKSIACEMHTNQLENDLTHNKQMSRDMNIQHK